MNATIEGLPAVLKRLKGIEEKVKKKATKAAVHQGGKVVLAEAKSRVRRVSGLLYKAMGQKVKTFRGNGVSVSIIGPRAGFKVIRDKQTGKIVGRVQTKFSRLVGTKNGKPVYENPTQYSHLVEKGTRRSRAFPFLAVALESKKDAATQAMANVLSNAIEDAAKGGT